MSNVLDEVTMLRCVQFSKVQPVRLDWLLEPLMPLAKVTLLVGDPGLGKSLFTTDVAARVSQGSRWPVGDGHAPKGSAVILSAEDDAGDTIRPRLDAACADVAKVYAATMVEARDRDGESERFFTLERDVPLLENLLLSIGDVRLVVVDPVSAYTGGADTHRNADVRVLLAPLAELAQRYKVSVVAVSHLNKGTGSAMYRTTGSLAFVAAARSVLAVVKDPNDPARRMVLPVKTNLSPDREGIAYRIAPSDNDAPLIQWEPDFVTEDLEDLMTPDVDGARSERDEAALWLNSELSGGPVATRDLQKRAQQAGHSWRTVRRAKDKLGVIAKRTGGDGGWEWWHHADVVREGGHGGPVQNVGHLGHLAQRSGHLATQGGQHGQECQGAGPGEAGHLGTCRHCVHFKPDTDEAGPGSGSCLHFDVPTFPDTPFECEGFESRIRQQGSP